MLAAAGTVQLDSVRGPVLLGELGLDGSVRGIRGVLPAVLAAARAGHRQVLVPAANADEAALVESVEVLASLWPSGRWNVARCRSGASTGCSGSRGQ